MDFYSMSVVEQLAKISVSTYQLGVENGNEETYENSVMKQKLKDQFAQLCLIQQNLKEQTSLIAGFDCNSREDFDEEYKEALKKTKRTAQNIHTSDQYLNFVKQIDEIVVLREERDTEKAGSEQVDEDLEINSSQTVLIDPFSKKPIQDPVRNMICNHVYERQAIMDALNANKRTKCAYVGCSNKQPVLPSSLKSDLILKAQLTQKQAEAEESLMQIDDDDK